MPEINVCPKPKSDIPNYTKKELNCLALNAYHEARGEGFYGMQLVTKVVLNRKASKYWPNNICNVVYQPYQFSWTHQNPKPPNKQSKAWKQAVRAAQSAYQLDYITSTYYHTKEIKPSWSVKMVEAYDYKNHVFY